MKFKKLILPMMAFVCAIGMAFATVDSKPEPNVQANDYLLINGEWLAIAEQPCTTTGPEDCQVQLGENGMIYPVYDEKQISSLKKSPTDDPTVIPPPF